MHSCIHTVCYIIPHCLSISPRTNNPQSFPAYSSLFTSTGACAARIQRMVAITFDSPEFTFQTAVSRDGNIDGKLILSSTQSCMKKERDFLVLVECRFLFYQAYLYHYPLLTVSCFPRENQYGTNHTVRHTNQRNDPQNDPFRTPTVRYALYAR
jgi:hypothetical protein